MVCGGYWAREVDRNTLAEVRVEDLRKPLRMGEEEDFSLYLSPPREMPSDDLLSTSIL